MISGEQLRLIRNLYALKQETIARKLRISQPAYCKLEKKKMVNEEQFETILAVFGCSKEELKSLIRKLPPPRK